MCSETAGVEEVNAAAGCSANTLFIMIIVFTLNKILN
jgi:hypothetical protein